MDKKKWYIYTMEYYTAEKNNDFLKFASWWIELENIILSEVTQIQKDNHQMYSLLSGFKHKAKNISPQITIPEILDNK